MLSEQPVIEGLTFDPEKHLYFYNGVHVPNNTSILQEAGLIDLSRIPRDRLEYKRILGTAVHYAIHLLNQDDLDESSLHPDFVPYIDGYKRFREVSGFEPRFSEVRLYSKKYGFATTLDEQGPFEWKGRTYESIIELKCTWEVYPSTGPQTAAQEIALNEIVPEIKNKRRFCLQLKGKDQGGYEIIPMEDPSDSNTFLCALQNYNWKKKHGLLKENKNVNSDRL